MPDRPYLFYELTNSLCSTCLRKVEAKVVIQDDRVYLHKWCPEHRFQKVLISTDAEYYKLSRQTLKPGQMPLKFNTPIKYGCPYDCGLCPDHEQHSCLTLVEITDQCNLTCPICYSESSPQRPTHRSLEQIEFMLDCVVRNEGEPDVVQISGGEPTIHPRVLRRSSTLAKARPIKHLMVNTNGVRIANDADFARRLAGLHAAASRSTSSSTRCDAEPLRALRGVDLTRRPPPGARSAQRAQHLHHARRHAEEGAERRRDRRDHRLRPEAAAACAASRFSRPGRRPAGGLRPGHRPPHPRRSPPADPRAVAASSSPPTSSPSPAIPTAWRWPTP